MTETVDGNIHHVHLYHPTLGLLALPVALRRRAAGSLEQAAGRPVPERNPAGHLLFVLPGGRRYAPPQP